MRILLVSDTHGGLDIINRLARKHGADYCLHAGDICCFDCKTVPLFTDRELTQMIKHSAAAAPLLKDGMSRKQLEEVAAEYHVFGDFDRYLTGEKQFDLPVYAVMGNREDSRIVKSVTDGRVANLTFLDDETIVFLGNCAVLGIGGTFSVGSLSGEMESPGVIYPTVSCSQLKKLAAAADGIPAEYKRIFVTHMGPDEVPESALYAQRLAADYIFSGHTHRFSAHDWTCDPSEAALKLHETYGWDPPAKTLCGSRSSLYFNLPKASRGYMVLDISTDGTDSSFQYYNIGT